MLTPISKRIWRILFVEQERKKIARYIIRAVLRRIANNQLICAVEELLEKVVTYHMSYTIYFFIM